MHTCRSLARRDGRWPVCIFPAPPSVLIVGVDPRTRPITANRSDLMSWLAVEKFFYKMRNIGPGGELSSQAAEAGSEWPKGKRTHPVRSVVELRIEY